jgi:DNA polymerase-1
MVEGVEADDVIGTLATRAAAQGIECIVSTSDKDLAQLVRPGITLVNTMSNEQLDEAGVEAKFGVRADQVLDLLTLTGDAVDNVPGVAKVGPKTAAKWLAQYGTLDAIIAHASQIPGVVGENLRAALDWLPQGKRLLTVKTDCALPVVPTDLQRAVPSADELRSLFARFEFKSWLRAQGSRRAAMPRRDHRAAWRENTSRSEPDRDEQTRGAAARSAPLRDGAGRGGLERWAVRSSGRNSLLR